jgi:hypothetical protein
MHNLPQKPEFLSHALLRSGVMGGAMRAAHAAGSTSGYLRHILQQPRPPPRNHRPRRHHQKLGLWREGESLARLTSLYQATPGVKPSKIVSGAADAGARVRGILRVAKTLDEAADKICAP